MSDSDTPNKEPLPESSEWTDESAEPNPDEQENPASQTLINLFQIADMNEDEPQPDVEIDQTVESDSTLNVEAETSYPESLPTLAESRNKDADWFALAQKMRQRNRRLLEQIAQLQNALSEKQDALNAEMVRSQEQDSLIVRQGEELNTLQEQLTRLFHTLESSHQAATRQQILIETLSEQLQSSQERVAQLERECALTQQRNNEQSHQLVQSANTCRELKTRLHRQQQQTLQFKVALEKCLEMPNRQISEAQPSRPKRDAGGVVPKAQPIQPWSAQQDFLADESSMDTEPLWNRPLQLDSLLATSASDEDVTEPSESYPSTTPTDSTVTPISGSTAAELEAERQLLAEMNSLAQASGLSEVAYDLTQEPNPWMLEAGRDAETVDESELSSAETEATEDEWNEENEVTLPQPNWPSPVVYPLRRPKKIKSLSSIELPSFPRYRPV
jgi:DNA repair exonuclease SbcCD ATPase subunit